MIRPLPLARASALLLWGALVASSAANVTSAATTTSAASAAGPTDANHATSAARADTATRAKAPPTLPGLVNRQHAEFTISQNGKMLGVETIRVYVAHDTLFSASAIRLDLSDKTGPYRFEKRTTFLQRALDSYPLSFQASDLVDGDSTTSRGVLCAFADTHVVVYFEHGDGGNATSLALPPGRLYILEPGVYLQVQILAADFVERGQASRTQPVLYPSLRKVLDVTLRRGPTETIKVGDSTRTATRVDVSDGQSQLSAWIADGKMLLLTSDAAKLRVERGRELPLLSATPSPAPPTDPR